MLNQRRDNRGSTWSGRLARRLRARRQGREERGASLVEYALLLALIAIVAIGALTFLGDSVSKTLNNTASTLDSTTAAPVAPSFSPTTASFTFVDLAAGTYTASANGSGPITYGETGTLPTGLTFDTGTGTISGIPAAGDYNGSPYTITISATNSVGPAPTPLTLTLTVTQAGAGDTPPTFTPNTFTYTFTDGTAGTYTPNAAGSPPPTYTESGALPPNITFANGQLTGTPALGEYLTNPSTTVTIKATNGNAPDATLTLTIDITQAPSGDSPPKFSPNPATATFTDGTAVNYTTPVVASGTAPITYSFDSGTLPPGTSYSNGKITGTPNAGDYSNSPYQVKIKASNAVSTDVLTLNITVNSGTVDHSAPVFNPTTATAIFSAGTNGSFDEKATGTPTPTYSISNGLPGDLNFSTTTGAITGSPS